MAADQGQAGQDDGSPGGFCIELHVKADGSMSVSVEPESEEQGEGEGEEQAQSVPNLQAAFKLMREIVDHAGQMADIGQGGSDMSSGYQSTGM